VHSLSRAPFPLAVPRFISGLISFSRGDARVCSGLHTTPVAIFDFRLTFGPDSAPGSFASRCGSPALVPANGSRLPSPAAKFAYANPLSPHGPWSDCLSTRVLISTQMSGWVSSGLLIPLLAFWSTDAFQFSLGQTGPPDLTASGPIPRCLTTLHAHNVLRQVSGFVSLRRPSQSLALTFLFTAPDWTTGPPRFPRSRHRDLL